MTKTIFRKPAMGNSEAMQILIEIQKMCVGRGECGDERCEGCDYEKGKGRCRIGYPGEWELPNA